MDSSLLQLFTPEELLKKLSEKSSTGGLHAFTPKESANIFFKEGVIVGAVKGLVEGEEVIKQVMEWSDARFVWQPDSQPGALAKPLQIDFSDFLVKLKAAPKLEVGGKILLPTNPAVTAPAKPETVDSHFITIPSKAATTGRLDPSPAPVPVIAPVSSALTATKNINPSPRSRVSYDESLLQRYPLVLVLMGETPEQRLKITRISSLIGRNPACDFTIENGSISRQHCLLQITERGLHVKDLATTNGTKINGITLTEGYVNVGDKIAMGNLVFLLEKDETAAA
jgi:hypothetical protein